MGTKEFNTWYRQQTLTRPTIGDQDTRNHVLAACWSAWCQGRALLIQELDRSQRAVARCQYLPVVR